MKKKQFPMKRFLHGCWPGENRGRKVDGSPSRGATIRSTFDALRVSSGSRSWCKLSATCLHIVRHARWGIDERATERRDEPATLEKRRAKVPPTSASKREKPLRGREIERASRVWGSWKTGEREEGETLRGGFGRSARAARLPFTVSGSRVTLVRVETTWYRGAKKREWKIRRKDERERIKEWWRDMSDLYSVKVEFSFQLWTLHFGKIGTFNYLIIDCSARHEE